MKKRQKAGEKVEFNVAISQNSFQNSSLRGIIKVVDESALVEIDRQNWPSSLITQIFLKNEIFIKSKNKEFLKNNKYVDWMFRTG